jgi:hemerythrin superfamily protein
MGQQAQPGSKNQSSSKRSTLNAIQLLTADHKKVSDIFEQFQKIKDKASDAEKHALVKQACNELTAHARIEEEIFYPALRAIQDAQDLLDEAEVEHTSIKKLVHELEFMNPGDTLYDAKFTVLAEYVKHHVKEEQGEIFPRAKKSGMDLDQLGEELGRRKQELAAQYGIEMEQQDMPHPSGAKRSRSASAADKSAHH